MDKNRQKIIIVVCIILAVIFLLTMLSIYKSKPQNLEAIDKLKEEPLKLSHSPLPQTETAAVSEVKKEETETHETADKPATQSEQHPSDAQSSPASAPKTVPEIEKKIQDALKEASATDNIKKLKHLTTELQKASEAARVYHVLGVLYMQLSPPDIAQAEEAFTNAAQCADSDADHNAIALATAQSYLQTDNIEKAQGVVTTALEQYKEISDARFQLCIMAGNLKLQAGDKTGAETLYKEVTDAFPAASKEIRLSTQSSYREACKRLAQLYKQARQRKEMGEIIQKMKLEIIKLEPDTAMKEK